MTTKAGSSTSRLVRGLVMLAILAVAAPLAAQVPPEPQAAILSRVLAYDRNLKARAGQTLVIGIVFRAEDAESVRAKDAMAGAFHNLEARTVQGLPVRTVVFAATDAKAVADWVAKENVGVVYVAPGLADLVKSINSTCAQRKAIAVTGVRAFVESGVPVGVVLRDNKPSILVNLPAAKNQGMDLDPKVLQLAELIR